MAGSSCSRIRDCWPPWTLDFERRYASHSASTWVNSRYLARNWCCKLPRDHGTRFITDLAMSTNVDLCVCRFAFQPAPSRNNEPRAARRRQQNSCVAWAHVRWTSASRNATKKIMRPRPQLARPGSAMGLDGEPRLERFAFAEWVAAREVRTKHVLAARVRPRRVQQS
jgi:hypothetical protein